MVCLSRVDGVLQALYGSVDHSVSAAHAASQLDRQQRYATTASLQADTELIYGECTTDTLYNLMKIITHHQQQHAAISSCCTDDVRFCDLGSGTGRMVLAVSMLYPQYKQCIGVELLPSLHRIATDAWHHLESDSGGSVPHSPCLFIQGDIRIYDWSHSHIVYINSTMYSAELMYELSKQCEKLPLHAYVITITNTLHRSVHRMFELIHTSKQSSTYGTCTCYIYYKRNNNKLINVILRAYN